MRNGQLRAQRNDLSKEMTKSVAARAENGDQQKALMEQLKFQREELDRTKISAPHSGQILNLKISGRGALVRGGEPLFELVPLDAKMVIETKIPPSAIDQVRVDDEVDIRMTGAVNVPKATLSGRITSVSRDVITDERGVVYYLARISLDKQSVAILEKFDLVSGMSVETIIKSGRHSILSYFLSPLIRRFETALTEN